MKKGILKYALLFAVTAVLASCGNNNEQESIKQQITQYKDQVSELNIKIKELENQLAEIEQSEDKFVTPVKANAIEYQPFRHYFQVSGTVDAVDKAFISPEINGQLTQLYVKEGDRVTKDQLLAKLNTSITENTIQEVKTQLELAKTLYEKQKQLWEQNIGSEVQYLQALNNKESLESKLSTLQAQLEMAYVRSPIDGIVDMIYIEPGELAIPGMQMMQLFNLSKLKVEIDVSERYLPVISKGDIVNLTFPSFPDINMDVDIYRTGNVIKVGNRTFPVELRIDNIEGKLKPNILAIVTFLDFHEDNALIVPSIIVKQDIEGKYVYVARNASETYVAKKVYITTGLSYNDETMVTSGLQPGDKVIVDGYSLVSDGTQVKLI
ncbi:MAG TPA: efflux RND transporter periplasmic adaptor subunit [Bacteroidales bacterium]|nr:efflux RND transporter periplasmic adaptor subunit [Bacteroidales bacterium]